MESIISKAIKIGLDHNRDLPNHINIKDYVINITTFVVDIRY